MQDAYLEKLFGEGAAARYAADIKVNAELLGLLDKQKDQMFTEDLIPDDPEKARVQFAAFKDGLLRGYEEDLKGQKQ